MGESRGYEGEERDSSKRDWYVVRTSNPYDFVVVLSDGEDVTTRDERERVVGRYAL